MPYGSGTTAMRTDTQRIIEEKILTKLNDLDLNVSGVTGVYSGAGAPSADPGVTAAVYFNTTNGEWYAWFSGAWH